MFTVTQNWQMPVNILVLVIFVFCIVRGWKKGVLRSVLSLVSMFLSIWLAWKTKNVFSTEFMILPETGLAQTKLFGMDAIYSFFNQIAWFLILFTVYRILFLILDRILKKLHSVPGIRQISEVLGGIFGGIQAVLWCLMLCVVLSTPLFVNGSLATDGTALGVIRDMAGSTGSTAAIPAITSSAFSNAQKSVGNLSEKEFEAIRQWLKTNGYEEKGETEQ